MLRIFDFCKLWGSHCAIKVKLACLPLAFSFFFISSGGETINKLNDSGTSLPEIKVVYPKNGTVFPPEFAAPEFSWNDSLSAQKQYIVSFSTLKSKNIFTKTIVGLNWRPDSVAWQAIKTSSNHDKVFFTVASEKSGSSDKQYSGTINFSISTDSVDASIFYRAVPLPFSYAAKNVSEIEWYMGRVSGEKPRKILDHIPVCANCHSFSKDGSQFAMDIDYANDKGSYIISPVKDTTKLSFEKIITWSDFKREDGEKTFGLLSQMSPDGRYVLSTVKDRSIFVPVDNLEYSQLFFPIKGILAKYDREKKTFSELQGANDRSMVQSNPSWSPDGKEIMFTRTSRYTSASIEKSEDIIIKPEDANEFLSKQKDFKFDLYRLNFNEGAGGVATPVLGASANNKSNYFARYSPDGEWVIFCQAQNFMLLQPDSKLYIMPTSGGTPRLMNCNMNNMNSWHSWSPNSKWIVFSSKNNGPYTQLYLSHIDEQGNDSPAIFLENLVFSNKAANIPEFINDKNHRLLKIEDSFSRSALYYTSQAAGNLIDNKLNSALENIKKALMLDSTYIDAYMCRITVYTKLWQTGSKELEKDKNTALRLLNKQLELKPKDKANLLKRANLEYSIGDFDAAAKDGFTIIKMNQDDFEAFSLLASVFLKKRDIQKTLSCYERMLKIRPDDKQTTYYQAILYQSIGQTDLASRIFDKLIAKYPTDISFYFSRANLLYNKGDKNGAKCDLNKAVAQNPTSFEVYLKRGFFWSETGQKEQAQSDLKKAIVLLTDVITNNPENISLLLLRAEINEQIGEWDATIADCDKYLEKIPLNYKALKQKAKVQMIRKNWVESINTLTLLIDKFTPESELFSRRSMVNFQLGRKSQALADMSKAQMLSPNDCSILFDLANLKENMGDNTGAQKDFGKIVSVLSDKKQKGNLSETDSRLLLIVTQHLKQPNIPYLQSDK